MRESRSALIAVASALAWNLWLPVLRDAFLRPAFAGDPGTWDFHAYYVAGAKVNAGLSPYRDHARLPAGVRDFVVDWGPGHTRFLYPPPAVVPFRLLALLPYGVARAVWLAGTVAALGLSFVVLLSWLDPASRSRFAWAAACGALTSSPLLALVRTGQIDPLIGCAALLSLASYERRWCWVSALLLSWAAATKLTPLAFVILFVVFYRDLGFALRFAIGCALWVGVGLVAAPEASWSEYLTFVLPMASLGFDSYYNQSLARLVVRITGAPKVVGLLGLASAAVLMAWLRHSLASQRPLARPTRSQGVAAFTALACVVLATAPIAWHVTYIWLLLPLSLVWATVVPGLSKAGTGLFIGGWVLAGLRPWSAVPLFLPNALGAVLICAVLVGWAGGAQSLVTAAERPK